MSLNRAALSRFLRLLLPLVPRRQVLGPLRPRGNHLQKLLRLRRRLLARVRVRVGVRVGVKVRVRVRVRVRVGVGVGVRVRVRVGVSLPPYLKLRLGVLAVICSRSALTSSCKSWLELGIGIGAGLGLGLGLGLGVGVGVVVGVGVGSGRRRQVATHSKPYSLMALWPYSLIAL